MLIKLKTYSQIQGVEIKVLMKRFETFRTWIMIKKYPIMTENCWINNLLEECEDNM